MSRVVATVSLSLDGVMQAPGRRDEDTRDGFTLGGWGTAYADQTVGAAMGAGIAKAGGLLFGRRTFEDFAAVWPARTDNPYSAVLTSFPKYVASRTLTQTPSWAGSTLLHGEAESSVAELKQKGQQDLVILGSGELVRSLLAAGLVDRFVLLIHPIVLGSGRRLFADRGPQRDFQLVDTLTSDTGVVVATYDVHQATVSPSRPVL